jgi:hypothetical protein
MAEKEEGNGEGEKEEVGDRTAAKRRKGKAR